MAQSQQLQGRWSGPWHLLLAPHRRGRGVRGASCACAPCFLPLLSQSRLLPRSGPRCSWEGPSPLHQGWIHPPPRCPRRRRSPHPAPPRPIPSHPRPAQRTTPLRVQHRGAPVPWDLQWHLPFALLAACLGPKQPRKRTKRKRAMIAAQHRGGGAWQSRQRQACPACGPVPPRPGPADPMKSSGGRVLRWARGCLQTLSAWTLYPPPLPSLLLVPQR